MAVIIVRFYFAATGDMSSAPRAESYRPHHALGPIIFFLPIVTAALAALARMSGRLITLLVSLAALAALQVLLTKLAQSLREGLSDAAALV